MQEVYFLCQNIFLDLLLGRLHPHHDQRLEEIQLRSKFAHFWNKKSRQESDSPTLGILNCFSYQISYLGAIL